MLRSSASERDLPETWKAARRRAFPDASAGPSDGGTSPGSGLAKRLVLRVGTYHGKIFDLPPVKIAPVPSAPIPVLIGGHSDAALRRAARLGDGWLRGGGDLPGLLARLDEQRRRAGTAGRPFEVHVISADAYTVDGVRRLAEQGVTDVIVGFRWPYRPGPDPEPLEHKITQLRRFADSVIAKVPG